MANVARDSVSGYSTDCAVKPGEEKAYDAYSEEVKTIPILIQFTNISIVVEGVD